MMKFRKLMLASAISSALLLAGCGGAGSDSEKNPTSGGSTSGGSTSGATLSLTGVVVKGVVKNGLVTAYELVNGAWVAIGTATTDASGAYAIPVLTSAYKGGIVKITLTSNAATQMKCELASCGNVSFGEFYAAPSTTLDTLVSSSNITSGISNIPITPYTNLVASRVNALVHENGTATQTDVAMVAASVIDPGVYFAMNSPAAVVGADAVSVAQTVSVTRKLTGICQRMAFCCSRNRPPSR